MSLTRVSKIYLDGEPAFLRLFNRKTKLEQKSRLGRPPLDLDLKIIDLILQYRRRNSMRRRPLSYERIANFLNEQGYLTKEGKKWAARNVALTVGSLREQSKKATEFDENS